MWSESEIHNYKKILHDELPGYFQNNRAEEAFDEMLEKARNLNSSELLDEKEAIDEFCEKLEAPPKLATYLKDKINLDPCLTNEEHFRNGVRLGKELYRIEQMQH